MEGDETTLLPHKDEEQSKTDLSLSTTARITVQRSSTGAISFQGVDTSGDTVTLENTNPVTQAKTQSLKGWRVIKEVNGKQVYAADLGDKELGPGQTLKLFSKGAKSKATSDNEIILDLFSWEQDGQFKLIDESGEEQATLTVKTEQ